MVGHENFYKGTKISRIQGKEELITAMMAKIPCSLTNDNLVFVCIGTDRCTGDSLGPLVGTYLEELGYNNVIGTLDDPCHAQNLEKRICRINKDKTVIAIDACLGMINNVETFSVHCGSIKPGAGVGKNLPEVGDYSITGIVNIGGFMEYFVLQNTRLSLITRMAKDITSAILEIFPLEVFSNEIAENGVSEKQEEFIFN